MDEQPRKQLGYTIPQAAEVAAVGESTLKAAIARGDLPRRYPSTRPIILASDLEKWLESLPTEPPASSIGASKRRTRPRSDDLHGLTLQQVVALADELGVPPESLLVKRPRGQ